MMAIFAGGRDGGKAQCERRWGWENGVIGFSGANGRREQAGQ